MKLLTSNSRGENYSFICLESNNDVLIYKVINEQIKSKQAVDFWFGFKSQTFRKSISDYAVHEAESTNGMAFILATKLEFSEKPTSIADYCGFADDIINDMHKSMFEFIDKGKMVRINRNGGYCPIDNLDEYHTAVDINEQEMFNYIVSGDINLKFEITSDTIVIENANYIPDDLIRDFNKLTSIPKNEMQIITSFKTKSILFKDSDYIKFFEDGIINHNLTNIVFQTTGQDTRQISGIKRVFEHIMSKCPDKVLCIYVKVYNKEVRYLFETNLKNIKIIFIER